MVLWLVSAAVGFALHAVFRWVPWLYVGLAGLFGLLLAALATPPPYQALGVGVFLVSLIPLHLFLEKNLGRPSV